MKDELSSIKSKMGPVRVTRGGVTYDMDIGNIGHTSNGILNRHPMEVMLMRRVPDDFVPDVLWLFRHAPPVEALLAEARRRRDALPRCEDVKAQ
jgi:hypothetical protein